MTSDLSPVDRLNEIRARLANATPGPWRTEYVYGIDSGDVFSPGEALPMATAFAFTDAEFIAAAPADVGWLLKHVEQLQAEIRSLQHAVQKIGDAHEAPPPEDGGQLGLSLTVDEALSALDAATETYRRALEAEETQQ